VALPMAVPSMYKAQSIEGLKASVAVKLKLAAAECRISFLAGETKATLGAFVSTTNDLAWLDPLVLFASAHFTNQDFLDLQCWFNLAWMDPLWKATDATVGHLYRKQRGFTEGEKKMLLDKQREICGLTISKHRELWQKGQIEVSTTPFYHPILPLLALPHPSPYFRGVKKRAAEKRDCKHFLAGFFHQPPDKRIVRVNRIIRRNVRVNMASPPTIVIDVSHAENRALFQ